MKTLIMQTLDNKTVSVNIDQINSVTKHGDHFTISTSCGYEWNFNMEYLKFLQTEV
jgi:hypothetical protein